uniref:Uncharacterized protein n=1 Tax=Panagrolaimus sp. ES5 TaxID=591445 RepID=A0AC34FEM7_9BILA
MLEKANSLLIKDTVVKKVLKAFESGKCNFDTEGPSYYQCLENLKDNRDCCKKGHVGADHSLKYCLDKCDGTKAIKPNHKYFHCKKYAESIRVCGKLSHFDLKHFFDETL